MIVKMSAVLETKYLGSSKSIRALVPLLFMPERQESSFREITHYVTFFVRFYTKEKKHLEIVTCQSYPSVPDASRGINGTRCVH